MDVNSLLVCSTAFFIAASTLFRASDDSIIGSGKKLSVDDRSNVSTRQSGVNITVLADIKDDNGDIIVHA